MCSSFFDRTLSCKTFDQANQVDDKYRWYNSCRAFTIQIMSRKVGRDGQVRGVKFPCVFCLITFSHIPLSASSLQIENFEDIFLQIWDWIMDKYSKGGVMTKSSGDSQEIARKGECNLYSFHFPPSGLCIRGTFCEIVLLFTHRAFNPAPDHSQTVSPTSSCARPSTASRYVYPDDNSSDDNSSHSLTSFATITNSRLSSLPTLRHFTTRLPLVPSKAPA